MTCRRLFICLGMVAVTGACNSKFSARFDETNARSGAVAQEERGTVEPSPSPSPTTKPKTNPDNGTDPKSGGTEGDADSVAPVVNAGVDMITNEAVVLDASVDDAGTIAAWQWSKISGPGDILFSSTTIANPTVSADADGVYQLRLVVTDAAGNSGNDSISFTWDTEAAPVDELSLAASYRRTKLAWQAASDAASYLVVRKIGSPVTWLPVRGEVYTPAQDLGSGHQVLSVDAQLQLTDPSLTNGTAYHYAIFSRDGLGNYSPAIHESGTPAPKAYGATSRACGFDMNRNGVIGEPADCRVCNGVDVDVDGDAVAEDLIYVDSTLGDDLLGTGSPAMPYQTIQFGLTQANGPSIGAEDIICIAGTFNDTVTIPVNGQATTYSLDGIEVPRNPLMIVGWDKDGDSAYPPFDVDDTAVLNGANLVDTAIDLATNNSQYFEMAHLSITDYGGTNGGVDGGTTISTGDFTSFIHIHDIVGARLNAGVADSSNIAVMEANGPNVLFRNNNFTEVCCRFFEPRGAEAITQHILDNTVTFAGSDGVTGVYIAASAEDIEVARNDFDVDPAAWTPSTDGIIGVRVSNSTENIRIVDNQFINFVYGLRLVNASGCSRPTNEITFAGNQMRTNYGYASYIGIYLNAGESGGLGAIQCGVQDLDILNNMIEASGATSMTRCLRTANGNTANGPHVGAIRMVGNTCIGNGGVSAIEIRDDSTHPQQEFVFYNNIFAGFGVSLTAEYGATTWASDGNVWDAAATFDWLSVSYPDLASWIAVSTSDASSAACAPTFFDSGGNDYHLDITDTCARTRGVDATAIVPADFDGHARPATNVAAGADQP